MKTIETLYADMMGAFEAETGFRMSSTGELALRFWAVAAQINALYEQADWTLRQSFPQTAEGEWLDRFAALRALGRRAAEKAHGVVRFTRSGVSAADTPIPAGTVCLAGGAARFLTDAAAVIPAGALNAEVAVTAAEAGSHGNAAAGAVTAMAVAPAGVSGCVNPVAFSGGVDREDDAALRARVLASYTTLPNGANAAYYKSQALSVAGVAAACVKPKARGLGTVDVVISAAEGVPAAALVAAVQARLEAAREIAVDVAVAAPETCAVAVTAVVKPAAGHSYATVAAAVGAALTAFFDGRLLGRSVTRAQLGALIYAVEGVENYTLSAPAADIAVEADELPVLSTVTLTEWGA